MPSDLLTRAIPLYSPHFQVYSQPQLKMPRRPDAGTDVKDGTGNGAGGNGAPGGGGSNPKDGLSIEVNLQELGTAQKHIIY